MSPLREKLCDLEKTLKADIVLGRLALGGLLGDERLRVYRDGRIEGALMLRPEMLRVPKRTPGPTDCVVAGEGFAGELCSPSATKRSFVANPRSPGYERDSTAVQPNGIMGFRVVRPGAKASEHGRFGTISPHTSPHPELEFVSGGSGAEPPSAAPS
ncbi:MAG: hypothetical protein IH974_00795 [Myxococcales bacterium]|nr:hypothetical protein [Myxococcales bacterium]